MRVLLTGGAGFIGSNLALGLARRNPGWELVAADNLYRRGSELNLPRLRAAGVEFAHVDVRRRADLERLGGFDAIVEAAAEPAVGADRRDGGRDILVDTNLLGARNCLELAAGHGSHFVALSTSRVYPIAPLLALPLVETETRFEIAPGADLPGISEAGISESLPLEGPRSLYGATKLAAELLATEYQHSLGLRCTVNRCGVIAGPWQMGTTEQGVFTHWMLSFLRGGELSYIGHGGAGKQVRDLLHVEDLLELLELQLADPAHWSGVTVNVGGGREGSLSLLEASRLCRELTGTELELGSIAENRPDDVPLFLSDCSRLRGLTDWRPSRSPRQALTDIHTWLVENPELAEAL